MDRKHSKYSLDVAAIWLRQPRNIAKETKAINARCCLCPSVFICLLVQQWTSAITNHPQIRISCLVKISVEIVAETPGPECMGRQPINYSPEWQRGSFAKCKAEEEETHGLIHAYSKYYTLLLGRTVLRTQPPHCQAPANSQICLRLSESRCPCRHGSYELLFAQSIWKRPFQWATPHVKHSNDLPLLYCFVCKKQIFTADTVGLNYWYT